MPSSANVLETMANRDQLVTANDPLLRPLIVAASDEECRAALESIVATHVLPVIRKIVQRQSYRDPLRVQDTEDIMSTVVLRLVRRLQRRSISVNC